jgi:hypothetical protein
MPSSILEVKIPDLAWNFGLPAMTVKENGDAAFATSPPPSPYALAGESLHPLINFLLKMSDDYECPVGCDNDITGDRVIIVPANPARDSAESKNDANQRRNAAK